VKRFFVLATLLGACDSDDGDAARPDAPTKDASTTVKDAPFACMPVAPHGPPAACLALAPSTIRGATPFGNLDLTLDDFGAGDCITISAAHLRWTGACGEELRMRFSYPVTVGSEGRMVMGSFDRDASVEFKAPGVSAYERVTQIHVDVVTWQEGQDTHDIDITINFVDPAYAIGALRVSGTFCDWRHLLC
jgi:hypothetical protein